MKRRHSRYLEAKKELATIKYDYDRLDMMYRSIKLRYEELLRTMEEERGANNVLRLQLLHRGEEPNV